MGSWNTRATRPARAQTGWRVTSHAVDVDACRESTGRSPDTAFRKVDLPAPLEPITVTNWPDGMSSYRPRSARFSIGRARVEGDFQVFVRATYSGASVLARPSHGRLSMAGTTRANVTSTAVTRFRSCAFRPMKSLFSASAMKKR